MTKSEALRILLDLDEYTLDENKMQPQKFTLLIRAGSDEPWRWSGFFSDQDEACEVARNHRKFGERALVYKMVSMDLELIKTAIKDLPQEEQDKVLSELQKLMK